MKKMATKSMGGGYEYAKGGDMKIREMGKKAMATKKAPKKGMKMAKGNAYK